MKGQKSKVKVTFDPSRYSGHRLRPFFRKSDKECDGAGEQKPHGCGDAEVVRGDANAEGDEFTKQS